MKSCEGIPVAYQRKVITAHQCDNEGDAPQFYITGQALLSYPFSYCLVAAATRSHFTVATRNHLPVAAAPRSHFPVAVAPRNHFPVASAPRRHFPVAAAPRSHFPLPFRHRSPRSLSDPSSGSLWFGSPRLRSF